MNRTADHQICVQMEFYGSYSYVQMEERDTGSRGRGGGDGKGGNGMTINFMNSFP